VNPRRDGPPPLPIDYDAWKTTEPPDDRRPAERGDGPRCTGRVTGLWGRVHECRAPAFVFPRDGVRLCVEHARERAERLAG
jgi:hypothetical protein